MSLTHISDFSTALVKYLEHDPSKYDLIEVSKEKCSLYYQVCPKKQSLGQKVTNFIFSRSKWTSNAQIKKLTLQDLSDRLTIEEFKKFYPLAKRCGIEDPKLEAFLFEKSFSTLIIFDSAGKLRDEMILPTCIRIDQKKVDFENTSNIVFRDGLYLTQAAEQQYKEQKKLPPSKEELDQIIQNLKEDRNELFLWEYDNDGCYARANLMISFLILLGIPEKNLGLQTIVPLDANDEFQWNFHISPYVLLADGTKKIIDPLLSSKSLSIEEWLSLMHVDPKETYDVGPNKIDGTNQSKSSRFTISSIPIVLSEISVEAVEICSKALQGTRDVVEKKIIKQFSLVT